jgi:hypothetical protein
MLKLDEAVKEVKQKSYTEIQVETAWKWSSRACAMYIAVVEAPREQKLAFWTMSEEYAHEGIEHAALSGDNASVLLKEIQEAMKPYQDKAFNDMEATFGQVSG